MGGFYSTWGIPKPVPINNIDIGTDLLTFMGVVSSINTVDPRNVNEGLVVYEKDTESIYLCHNRAWIKLGNN